MRGKMRAGVKSRQKAAGRGTFWAVFLIAGVVSVPLLTNYLLTGSELLASLSRIEAVRLGIGRVFPIRIGPWGSRDYGFGGASFQGDVFYLIPAFLRAAGLSLAAAYKLTLFLINVATAALSLWCFGRCFKCREIGVMGSLLYTWCPYRLTELYIRGNLGDLAAWTFLPLILWGLTELYNGEEERRGGVWVILTWGFSLVAVSSVNLFFLSAGMTVLFLLFMGKRTLERSTLLVLGKTAGAVFLINAWFLIPMALRLRDPMAVGVLIPPDFRGNGMYLAQYLNIFLWGGANDTLGQEGMAGAQAMGPGAAVAALLFVYLWALFTGKGGETKEGRRFGRGLLLLSLALVILSLNSFPWDVLQDKNMLFSIVLSLLYTPARWGIPACACMITAACLVLAWMKGMNGGKEYKIIMPAVAAVSFGVTQFMLGNLLKTRPYIRQEETLELIPLEVIEGESMVWRVCEGLSAAALCGCLALFLIRRRKDVKNG